jgi:hypothetical protein
MVIIELVEEGRGPGKVMVCADEALGEVMIRTGGAAKVGLAGEMERERMVPSARVMAGEFGRRVIGEAPGEGVTTREETEG